MHVFKLVAANLKITCIIIYLLCTYKYNVEGDQNQQLESNTDPVIINP